MAKIVEFCTNCGPQLGRDIDIDVQAEFDKLKPNQIRNTHCAGCGLIGIANIDGKMKVTYDKFRGKFINYKFDEDGNIN